MEKERKISRGIIAGCLMIVVALTIWVININDTYSIDPSQCPTYVNGYRYERYTAYGVGSAICCPLGTEEYYLDTGCLASGLAIVGKYSNSDSCYRTIHIPTGFEYTRDAFDKIEAFYKSVDCSSLANDAIVENRIERIFTAQGFRPMYDDACYICDEDDTYIWNRGVPDKVCNKGWNADLDIDSEDECAKKYNVTFNVGDGELYLNNRLQSKNSFPLLKLDYSIYTAKKDGYTFNGWDEVEDCTSVKTTGVVELTNEKTLYACYKKNDISANKYSVYLDASSKDGIVYENNVSIQKSEYVLSGIEENSNFNLKPFTTKLNGYVFKGWSISNSCDSLISTYKITEDKRFYACYEKKITCEYSTADSCELANTGYNCIKDSNNCYVRGNLKQNGEENNPTCTYDTKTSCENAYSEYNCNLDSNGCYVKGSKKNNSSSDLQEPSSNPNTGNPLLQLFVLIGILTLVYIYCNVKKVRK